MTTFELVLTSILAISLTLAVFGLALMCFLLEHYILAVSFGAATGFLAYVFLWVFLYE